MAKKQSKKQAAKAAKKAQQQRTFALIAVAVTFVIFAIFSMSSSGDVSTTINILPPEISVGMAHQKIAEGAFLLDVRAPEEWVEHHVEGATLIPLDELEARVREVPADQEVIVICHSGNRAKVGRDILLAAGHPSVTSVTGGIQSWMKAGYATVTGE